MRFHFAREGATAPFLGMLVGVSATILAPSCVARPVIDVSLSDPLGLLEQAAFAQVVIFNDGCPEKEQLAEGDLTGARTVLTAEPNGAFSEIGNLDKTSFGFAALLRQDDCGVIGFGCTPADLEVHRHVAIAINEPVDPARGACVAPSRCEMAACVGGSGDGGLSEAQSDSSGDAGNGECELSLVGAEAFDLPASGGSQYDGPVVVPTPSGFVVVYREIDATGLTNRGVRQHVSDSATKGNRMNVPIGGCETGLDSNGVTATWNNVRGAGLMAVSMPPCSTAGKGAIYVSSFDQGGGTIAGVTYELPSPISVAPVRGSAAHPQTALFLVAANTGALPFLYTFEGLSVQADPPSIFNNGGASTFALVSSNGGTWGTLVDTGNDTLAFSVEDVLQGVQGTGTLPGRSFATMTTWPGRAAIVAPDGANLAWHAVDAQGQSVQNGTLAGGPYTAVDATTLFDHVLIAGAQVGKITVFRLDDARGAIQGSTGVKAELSAAVGSTSLTGYLGERVSIGAIRNRVVVAWVTSRAPLSGATSVPGGYAVLSCNG